MKTKQIILTGFLLVACIINPATGQQQHAGPDAGLLKKAQRIHEKAFVFDAHAHSLVFSKSDQEKNHPDAAQLNIESVRQGGIDGVGLFFAYYPIQNETLSSRVRKDMQRLHNRITSHHAGVRVASDIQNLRKDVKNTDPLVVPGVEYFFGAFNGDVQTIDSLYEAGIRSITLMDNPYDVLSEESHESGNENTLTIFGKKIIQRMNKKGMLIDISHLGDAMQLNVIHESEAPVIASHSPVRGVHDVPRNIPDPILERLAEKDGAIMITFNSGDLAGVEEGRCKIERLIDHIDHAVQVAGTDHVGIGSDFNGAGRRSPRQLEDASGFPWITYHLLERGYTEEEIKKILGGNYLRILSEI